MFKPRHIAQVCREGMGALVAHVRDTTLVEHWDQLNDRQRKLSVAVVNFILATPDATPETCHQLWTEKMRHEEGYVYGEFRDDTQRTHPDLVSFRELNPFAVVGYAMSIGIVRGMQDIAHRYENCAPKPEAATPHALVTEAAAGVVASLVAAGTGGAGDPIAAALEPVVAPLVTAMEETLSQIESTPGDVAVYGIDKPSEETIDKVVEDVVDKVVEDVVDEVLAGEPHFTAHNELTVESGDEPKVDVQ